MLFQGSALQRSAISINTGNLRYSKEQLDQHTCCAALAHHNQKVGPPIISYRSSFRFENHSFVAANRLYTEKNYRHQALLGPIDYGRNRVGFGDPWRTEPLLCRLAPQTWILVYHSRLSSSLLSDPHRQALQDARNSFHQCPNLSLQGELAFASFP